MCLQCVAEGSTYVGGAVGALQVLKVRARSRRRAGEAAVAGASAAVTASAADGPGAERSRPVEADRA